MVDRKKIFILSGFIIAVILVLIIVRSLSIKKVSINTVYDIIKDSDYTLVYSGDYNNDVYKELKQLRDKYGVSIYLFSEEKNEVIDYLYEVDDLMEDPQGNLYVIYDKGGFIGYIDDTRDKDEYFKKYIENYIPIVERNYKEPTIDELKELYNSKNKTIIVLGNEECSFCSKLEHVINEVAASYKYDINYINVSRYTDEDIENLYNLELIVPAECTKANESTNIRDGYAKPMTLVTKKGKVIGCIKGYYDRNTYTSKLNKILE